jgi:hypothetical protein
MARIMARQPSDWLRALRVYFGVVLVGNLIWEVLHLPLYAIWRTGTLKEQAFAAGHCLLGDLLIAMSALTLALLLAGDQRWPLGRFWPTAILTIAFGLAYTGFSEWLNVFVRAAWAYSDWMPTVSIAALKIGLSPLLQWIVVPVAAFAIVRWATTSHPEGVRR